MNSSEANYTIKDEKKEAVEGIQEDGAIRAVGKAPWEQFKDNYRSMGFVESPGLTMISILYLAEKLNTSISELVKPMQKWAHSGEFEFDLATLKDSKEIILQKLNNKYFDGDINKLDGVDIHYPESRILVRPSGTHNALICIVEGATPEIMYAKKQELLELLGATEDMMIKWG